MKIKVFDNAEIYFDTETLECDCTKQSCINCPINAYKCSTLSIERQAFKVLEHNIQELIKLL
jgi:hypothetical protein